MLEAIPNVARRKAELEKNFEMLTYHFDASTAYPQVYMVLVYCWKTIGPADEQNVYFKFKVDYPHKQIKLLSDTLRTLYSNDELMP